MKAVPSLPEKYHEIYSIELQKDKKMALWLNVLSIVISVAVAIPAHLHIPISLLFDMSSGMGVYWIRFAVMLVAMVVYMVLHELVHGITMKLFGTKKVTYGFTGLYAFAGSSDYYPKIPYITIALAPVVVWGVVIALICLLVPNDWFWVAYMIQIANLSGAAGDLFVTFRFSRMPKDILIRDHGVGMQVYSREGA